MKKLNPYAAPIRQVIESIISGTPGRRAAVFLSGGVDSLSILLACKAVGKSPVAYSFYLDGQPSTDYRLARDNASYLNIPFVGIPLPTDLEELAEDVTDIILNIGLKNKAGIECCWPFLKSFPIIDADCIFSGSAADGYFGLSKKAMIHYRDTLPAFRREYFSKPDPAQWKTNKKLAKERFGLDFYCPYAEQSRELLLALGEATWWELNTPLQKQPIRDMYPEIPQLKIKPHTNLQLGDSGIAELFATLAKSKGYKSPVGYYNDVARERLSPPC